MSIKLKDYVLCLQKLVDDGYGNLFVAYASDDEGNNYQKVYATPEIAQVHNIEEYNLELVGFKGEDSITNEDLNIFLANIRTQLSYFNNLTINVDVIDSYTDREFVTNYGLKTFNQT